MPTFLPHSKDVLHDHNYSAKPLNEHEEEVEYMEDEVHDIDCETEEVYKTQSQQSSGSDFIPGTYIIN